MASQNQRDKMRQIKAEQEEEDLFGLDLEPEVAEGQTDYERLVKLRKSPLHLLLLIHLPDIGLESGQTVYVNTGDPDRTEHLIINDDATITSDLGTFKSLSAASKAHKKDTWAKGTPDGWETIKIADISYPGKYRSLNTLFVQSHKWTGIPLEILEDEDALYNYLVSMNLGKYADLYYTQVSSKNVSGSQKSEAKSTTKSRPKSK